MARLDKVLAGTQITDEYTYRTGSTALGLLHDAFLASTVVVRTAAGGGGTLLTLTTDYTLSAEDTRLTTEAGATVYTKLAVVNGTYQNVALYVSYKCVTDYAKAADINASIWPGKIDMTATVAAPAGWLLCDGAAYSRLAYADLFSAIGTTWGVGDGSTTFNVPDFREASPYGAGTFSAVTGTTHGAITAHDAIALGQFGDDQAQIHSHAIYSVTGSGSKYMFQYGSNNTRNTKQTAENGSIGDQIAEGSGGTPRTGTTTRGKIIGVNFVIKY
jgi:microcystin-dependent protein